MILSDVTIAEFLKKGKIVVLPEFDQKDIRPAGIRLHLGSGLLVPEKGQVIDLAGSGEVSYKEIEIEKNGYELKPDEFVLGSTFERFQVPRDIVCHVDGRSTVARVGLSIHCTSQVIDGNFDEPRTIVLEMKNIGPSTLLLRPRFAIAMLTFSQLTAPIAQKSQEQYRGQRGVRAPNLKVQKR